jgi:hypothetical protein
VALLVSSISCNHEPNVVACRSRVPGGRKSIIHNHDHIWHAKLYLSLSRALPQSLGLGPKTKCWSPC